MTRNPDKANTIQKPRFNQNNNQNTTEGRAR